MNALGSFKRVSFFSAGRVTLFTGTTFFSYKRGLTCLQSGGVQEKLSQKQTKAAMKVLIKESRQWRKWLLEQGLAGKVQRPQTPQSMTTVCLSEIKLHNSYISGVLT